MTSQDDHQRQPGTGTDNTDATKTALSGENAPGENAPGENATGENATGENATGENATGENPAGENSPGEVNSRSVDFSFDLTSERSADTMPHVEAGEVPEGLDEFDSSDFITESGSVGRYEIQRELGSGGFGVVLLAIDADLQRHVAIKIPHQERIKSPRDVDRFLLEARTLARLDHPGVVPIYDFGRFEDRCFVVTKYIEGGTVSSRMKQERLSTFDAIKILHSVTTTLDFIHASGIVHRDIKPANLLLNESGDCYVTDFGLALLDNSLLRKPGRIGTFSYMSPEQARGESHLVDGRSDLFSVGVMMYEMLCGRRPFVGESWRETLELICDGECVGPRQIDSDIPKELERICLKLLSKRAADRYQKASELAEDLKYYLDHNPDLTDSAVLRRTGRPASNENSSDQLVGIVPRGLRSFDQEDADYFAALLPGPFDRRGIPESLSFWKRRIESDDPSDVFRVGVIYGSSGSGKSSFMRAGLLPLLDRSIEPIVLDASIDRTERELLGIFQTRCPSLPQGLNLVESLAWIRNHIDQFECTKFLIVIDQFEQWLHGATSTASTEMVRALRQCDGVSVQCILLVRDDFWVGVSRLAAELEIDLVRSRNLAMIDLFDKRHARKVLAEYGRSYGRLPDNLADLTADQRTFLDRAIDGLAADGMIVPVQLVTFAEIFRSRPWSEKALHGIGGVEAVGTRFLDESLGANARPENRAHQTAAQLLLKSLLPESGSNIKGAMRSESQLQQICGYADQRQRFDQMIAILDQDLRLITPTDAGKSDAGKFAEGKSDEGNAVEAEKANESYYQLTHDFLVPAIRHWLQRNQRMTIAGRAAMRLVDRAEVWSKRQESSLLPSWLEWVVFHWFTKRGLWDEGERRMMHAANRKHLINTAIALFAMCLLGWSAIQYRGRSQAQSLTQQLSTATTNEVGGILDQLQRVAEWSDSPIRALATETKIVSRPGLHARLALLRNSPLEPGLYDEIAEYLIEADIQTVPLIRQELQHFDRWQSVRERLWKVVSDPAASDRKRVAAGVALIDDNTVSDRPNWELYGADLISAAIRRTIERPQEYLVVVEQFAEVSEQLYAPLLEIFRGQEPTPERKQSLNLILDWWENESETLARTFLDSDSVQAKSFLPMLLPASPSEILPVFVDALNTEPKPTESAQRQQEIANRQANAAAMLMRLGHHQRCWKLLRHDPIPNTRSGLIERAVLLRVDPQLILQETKHTADMDVRSGLLLMLGSFDLDELPEPVLRELTSLAKTEFQTNPSADVHSAAYWLLRRVGDRLQCDVWLNEATARLSKQTQAAEFGWTVNSHGMTLIRFPREDHILEVAAHEITLGQYQQFKSQFDVPAKEAPSRDCPVMGVNWFESAAFCRWLSRQDGLEEEDQCHPENSRRDGDLQQLVDDFESRKGWRLLLPEEWESACFGASITRFSMGHDEALVPQYGWTLMVGSPVHPIGLKKPLASGVFGMYGNVSEWCAVPQHQIGVKQRPIRGIACNAYLDRVLRLSRSGSLPATTKFYSVGFRICRQVPRIPR